MSYCLTAPNGTKNWFKEKGVLHREGDKPALVLANNEGVAYYKNGRIHREKGPAIIGGGRREYWLFDIKLKDKKSHEKFLRDYKFLKRKKYKHYVIINWLRDDDNEDLTVEDFIKEKEEEKLIEKQEKIDVKIKRREIKEQYKRDKLPTFSVTCKQDSNEYEPRILSEDLNMSTEKQVLKFIEFCLTHFDSIVKTINITINKEDPIIS